MTAGDGIRLRIEVERAPEPGLLRAAVAARVNGRSWTGPEAPIADAVAALVAGRLRERARSVQEPEGGPAWR